MPNLFNKYGNGTFETGDVSVLIQFAQDFTFTGVNYRWGRVVGGVPLAGTGCARFYNTNPPSAVNLKPFFLRTPVRDQGSGAVGTGPFTAGTRYTYKTNVYVPAVGGMMNDDCWVGIGNSKDTGETRAAFALRSAPDVNGVCTATLGSGVSRREFTFIKVSNLHAYKELSYSWQEPSSAPLAYTAVVQLYVFVADADVNAEMVPTGEFFMDNASVEAEVIPVCNLVSTTGYTKTDETEEDSNDGSINLSGYSTDSPPLFYSINGGTNFFASPIFTGLAPGVYPCVVKDSNVLGCELEFNVTILAGDAPPPDPEPEPEATCLEVDSEPVNRNNFVTWYSALGFSNFNCIEFTNCFWRLPNEYVKIKSNEDFHKFYAVMNEELSFYINFEEDFIYNDFAFVKLAVINKYGMVQPDVAPLNKDEITSAVFNIWANVTLVGLVEGEYRFMLYNSVTNATLFISNTFGVLPEKKAKKKTIRLQTRSSVDFYKYRYTPEGMETYLNKVRLKMNKVDQQGEGQLTQYRAVSTGKLRNTSFELDRYVVLESLYFNELAHEAMDVMQLHDTFIINDKSYKIKELYKVETNEQLAVNKGTISIYEQNFSMANRYGTPDLIIVGSDDPLLEGDGESFIKL